MSAYCLLAAICLHLRMRVRVIKKGNVREHFANNRLSLKYFEDFFNKLGYADWQKPQDMTQMFKSADLITCKAGQRSRIVFN